MTSSEVRDIVTKIEAEIESVNEITIEGKKINLSFHLKHN